MLTLFIWLLQDIFQVIFMGVFLVPDFFLITLIYAGLKPESEHRHTPFWYIITGFIGGLFWDLRWTNIIGLTAGLNGVLLSAVFVIWHIIPAQGRSERALTGCMLGVQFISAFVHMLMWTVSSAVTIRLFIIQQLMGIAIILFLSFVYKKAIHRHV